MQNVNVDVASFDAQLRGVLLPFGLRLDTVQLKGAGLHVEKDPFLASLERPGELTVTVLQESLQEFLNKKSPGGLSDFEVSVQEGRLFVQATKNMIFDVRATAVCTLRIVDGAQLFVDLESVDVLGGGGLTSLVRSQMESLNPIFDAADLPVKAVLTDVQADSGRVVVHGLVEP